MAHTYDTDDYRDVWGSRFVRKVAITLVDNYATGGWALTAADLGFGSSAAITAVVVMNPAVAGAILSLDDTNGKLMARDYAGDEIANSSAALDDVVVELLVLRSEEHT